MLQWEMQTVDMAYLEILSAVAWPSGVVQVVSAFEAVKTFVPVRE